MFLEYMKYANIRDERKLTDYRVAMDTVITKSTFADWKSGRSKPKLEKIATLAKYFDVPIEYFLEQHTTQQCGKVWTVEAEEEVVQVVRPEGTKSAKVIQVIEAKAKRGLGTEKDPVRVVTQYWDFEGNFLAEMDTDAQYLTELSMWESERLRGIIEDLKVN